MNFSFISNRHRERYLRITEPVGRLMVRWGVHPNVITVAGLLLSIVAGLVYATGSFFWGAWVLALAGACDTLDGQLAREAGKESRFGAFLDSTLDRYGEVAVFLGLAWWFSGGAAFKGGGTSGEGASPWAVVFIVLAVAGSLMVIYSRARAEGLGVECKAGFMQRPERIVVLIIGSLLGGLPLIGLFIMKLTLFSLAVLANVTAIQRIVHVRNQLLRSNRAP